jgi:thiol-disulfide isomerase/thioredoxin
MVTAILMKRLSFALILAVAALAAFVIRDLTSLNLPKVDSIELPVKSLPILMVDGILPGKADFSLDQLKGKVFVMHWWASWCEVCQDDIPQLIRLWNNPQTKAAVNFVAVASSDEVDAAATKAIQLQIPYLVLFDPIGDLGRVFGMQVLPYTCLFDAKGYSRYCWSGGLAPSQLDQISEAIELVLNKN